jgi:hypothetical protein
VPADRGSDNGDNAPDSIDDSASETTGIMPWMRQEYCC